jgi:hypothetical protein
LSVNPLPPAIADAFRDQEKSCTKLGSPFTAALCRLIAENGVPGGPVHERLSNWSGRANAGGDALPLRLAGALHYLVLSGTVPELSAVYPPQAETEELLFARVADAIGTHVEFIDGFLDNAPQTNETARSAALLPGFLLLHDMFRLPMVISELGSSAGLNQNWHRFRYDYGNWQWGEPRSPVTLTCEWRGNAQPPIAPVTVVECAGCDIAPVPLTDAAERLRLKSYIWPDQPARLERLDGALEIAARALPTIDKAPAADWLENRLSLPRPGQLHVVFHTIMWQYMSTADQQRIDDMLDHAGQKAHPGAPLAWLRLETDDGPKGAGLTMTTWSGRPDDGKSHELGRGDFHGRWVEWNGLPA